MAAVQTTSKRSLWLGISIGAVAVAAIMYWAYAYGRPGTGTIDNPGGQSGNTKPYTNAAFGFTLSYPDTWRTQECNDEATTLVAIGDRENLVVCSSDAPLNAYIMASGIRRPYWEGTLADQVNQVRDMYDDVKISQLQVDGVAATKVEGKMKKFDEGGFPQYVEAGTIMSQVLFVKGDILYRIHFQDLAGTNSTEEFEKIVESFRFAN